MENKNIRKISKVGGGKSFSVIIPIEMIRELKWREKQKVVFRKSGKKIIIEDWKKK